MASSDSLTESLWLQTTVNGSRRSILNLVNLLLRNSQHRVTVLDRCDGPDPQIFVVTRVVWRDPDINKPIISQLPKILSLLETLRGSMGVPREVYLDSTEGIAVYLPTGIRVSELPDGPKDAISLLMTAADSSLQHMYSTMDEVENWFWRVARQRGFSPKIVERMGRKEVHYDSRELIRRFQQLLYKYFSLRFTIHRSESCLRLED